MNDIVAVSGLVALAIAAALVGFRKRIGILRTASWLVTLGAFILLSEHPQFSILYALQAVYPEGQAMALIPHARIHFLMAGVYSLLCLALLVLFAWEGLSRQSKTTWYAILATLLIGGGADLISGATLYQHGFPVYTTFGINEVNGFGWQFLYVYLVSWIAALAISYRPVFHPGRLETA